MAAPVLAQIDDILKNGDTPGSISLSRVLTAELNAARRSVQSSSLAR
jgi:hypothetical protein